MAVSVIATVFKSEVITDKGELLVVVAMADFCDDQGYCFPSIPTLAQKCRMTERSVQRITRRLRGEDEEYNRKTGRKPLISVSKMTHENGKVSNRYKLHLDLFLDAKKAFITDEKEGEKQETTPDTVSPPPRHSVAPTPDTVSPPPPTQCRPNRHSNRHSNRQLNVNSASPKISDDADGDPFTIREAEIYFQYRFNKFDETNFPEQFRQAYPPLRLADEFHEYWSEREFLKPARGKATPVRMKPKTWRRSASVWFNNAITYFDRDSKNAKTKYSRKLTTDEAEKADRELVDWINAE